MTTTYTLVIDTISSVSGSGSVDVSFHRQNGDLPYGVRDGFETRRLRIDPAGDHIAQIVTEIGETETVEIEDEADRLAHAELSA
jgi:hypothetical protein